MLHKTLFYLNICEPINSDLSLVRYIVAQKEDLVSFAYVRNIVMGSINSWPLYNNATTTIRDIIHRPVFYLKHKIFRNWIQPPFSDGTYSVGYNR
jgi:hypothetical protein